MTDSTSPRDGIERVDGVVDLTQCTRGDRLRVTTDDGEVFEGVISETDGDSATDYRDGWTIACFEGDFWEQVQDRVDSEVLELRQDREQYTDAPEPPELTGDVLVDDELRDTEIGRVASVERLTDRTETNVDGTLHDSYHAALQHSHDEPDDDDLVIGVVREPMYGIQKHIDENWPELAPSRELLDEFKTKADEIGHNAAVDAVGFQERYRDSLDGAAQEKIHEIVGELRSGRDVWVVCYENTDDKFCHREILTTEIMQVANDGSQQ